MLQDLQKFRCPKEKLNVYIMKYMFQGLYLPLALMVLFPPVFRSVVTRYHCETVALYFVFLHILDSNVRCESCDFTVPIETHTDPSHCTACFSENCHARVCGNGVRMITVSIYTSIRINRKLNQIGEIHGIPLKACKNL